MQKNVYDEDLLPCCFEPLTGATRSGFCESLPQDTGKHFVCAHITDEFLQFSLKRGNDLITPQLQWGFQGLKEGDFWCLCVSRWLEAYHANCAPPLKLDACHKDLLMHVSLETLEAFSIN